jgi:hypothetical protein
LTSGVDYFKRRGRADKGGVNPAAENIKKVDSTAPKGTGINVNTGGGESGFSQPLGSGGTPGSAPMGMTAEQAQATLGLGSQAAGLIGLATNNPALGQMAGQANTIGQAALGNFGPAAIQAASQFGLDANALGLAANVASGNQVGVVNSVANMASPMLGIANTGMQVATGLFGDTPTSFGDVAINSPIGTAAVGNQGPVDTAQAGMAINNSPDPIGAFMGTLGENVSANPAAAQAAAQSLSWGLNTPFGTAQSMVNTNDTFGNVGYGSNTGGYGIAAPSTSSVNGGLSPSTPSTEGFGLGSGNSGLGLSLGSSGLGLTASPSETGVTDATGGGFGPDGGGSASGNSGSAGPGGVGADGSPGDGVGNGTGGWADGGMIGYDTPGLTKRYADGGGVMSQPQMQMQMGGQPDAQNIQAQVAQTMRDPQRMRQLLARPQALMQSGELTPDEVVTMGRVAEAAMFNPSLYPQLRQFVAQQGMTPLPPAFDPSVIVSIIVIARALQQGQGATPAGQIPPTSQAQMENPIGMANGGYLRGPGTGRSDSIGTQNVSTGEPVKVANGEYVIPAHVVRAKGRDFFDGLLRKYTSVPKGE